MKINSFWCGALTMSAIWLGATLLYYSYYRRNEPVRTTIETVTKTDTVTHFVERPVPKDSMVVKYKYLTVKIPSATKDTVVVAKDTVISIPITQKVYEDSTYKAWVSGYEPSLDSIRVFQPVTTITTTITNTETRKVPGKWGIGVQAGVGYTTSRKVEPYIGIGVSYNIFSW